MWSTQKKMPDSRGKRLAQMFFALFAIAVLTSGCSLFHGDKTPLDSAVKPPAAGEAYRIGPDDILMISVWKDPDLTREVIVRPDGYISFPLVGEIKAGGMTVAALKDELTGRISEYIPEVNLTVMVTQFNKIKIYVIGKVNRPGEFRPGKHVNVMQALSLAGGLTPFADKNNIIVLRTMDDNRQIQIPFNYKKVKKGKDLAQNIILHTGDVVVVP
ncbi:MAG: polysaccharide biosynthesis/export family protein [Thermodesulfobacteriota bacterium]|nr:polysaccharide biosynthesis/export family protein [Thermodesulfobacteriota bacterium]